MLSKAQIKYIRSLTQQKYRKEHNVFIAEGDKIAKEWLNSKTAVQYIAATEVWLNENRSLVDLHPEAQTFVIDEQILSSISALQTPNQVLLVVEIPGIREIPSTNGWTIALENIQDPGNMGTIIRIADWFGIANIVCSGDCVDIYNPKVVQAAMGGHLRVEFFQKDLLKYVSAASIPVLAATLSGKSIYDYDMFPDAILLIGNESKGLSKELIDRATHLITIPRFGGAESLNAAVSTGIICSHLIPH